MGQGGEVLRLFEFVGAGEHDSEVAFPCRRIVAVPIPFGLAVIQYRLDALAHTCGGFCFFLPDGGQAA